MSRSVRALIAGIIVVGSLAGCGSGTSASSLLGDTKAPAQLLRNEVASRVPQEVIESLADSVDASEGCGKDGMMRAWRSTQLMFITPAKAGRLLTVVDGMVASLSEQGWAAESTQPSSKVHEERLTSSRIESVIRLRAVEASDDEGHGATIELSVTGPCVMTDGPDSDEVKRLEGRD